jgi:hypothetical protein
MHSGSFPFRRKGTDMFINYRLEDGSTVLVEVTEETAAYILENDREMANADRKERYHCPYHIEAMQYEGDSLAYRLTPEEVFVRKGGTAAYQRYAFLPDRRSASAAHHESGRHDAPGNCRCGRHHGQCRYGITGGGKEKIQKTFLKITCTKQPVFLRIVKDLTSSERSKNAMNKLMKGGRPNETHHHLYGKLQG